MSLCFLFFFKFAFPLSFFSFSYLFAAVIVLYWASFQFKNVCQSIFPMGNFCHGVAKWSCRELIALRFSVKFLSIFMYRYCISQAPLSQSLWSGHHWKAGFSWKFKVHVDREKFQLAGEKLHSLQSRPQKMYTYFRQVAGAPGSSRQWFSKLMKNPGKDLFLLQNLSLGDVNFNAKVMTSEMGQRPTFIMGNSPVSNLPWLLNKSTDNAFVQY